MPGLVLSDQALGYIAWALTGLLVFGLLAALLTSTRRGGR